VLISRLVRLPFDSGPLDQSQARRDGPDPEVHCHSIVSSAVASSVGGISIPSCRAVFMLITSS
jgi:hypothetical protein